MGPSEIDFETGAKRLLGHSMQSLGSDAHAVNVEPWCELFQHWILHVCACAVANEQYFFISLEVGQAHVHPVHPAEPALNYINNYGGVCDQGS